MSKPSGSALAVSTLARLKARIGAGEWPLGSRMPTEPQLAEQLGVGRSTVREAIRSLATLGMVETLTARGTFVRSLTPAPSLLLEALSVYSPAELIGMRRALDVEAVQAASARWTDADMTEMEAALANEDEDARLAAPEPATGLRCTSFHATIAKASGNRLLADLDVTISAALDASGLGAKIAQSLDAATLSSEHDRILTCIRERDVARAAHLMAVHSDGALRSLDHEPILTSLTSLDGRGEIPSLAAARERPRQRLA